LFDLRENALHLLTAEGAHSVTLDVAHCADPKHKSAHGLVIGCVDHNHHVVRAHGPEFLDDLHPHLLGLGDRGLAALDGSLDVSDALFGKLNKTELPSPKVRCFRSGLTW